MSHLSNAQKLYIANGNYIGQHKCRIFLRGQKVLLDKHCIQGSSMNTEDICYRIAGSQDILKMWQVQFLLK